MVSRRNNIEGMVYCGKAERLPSKAQKREARATQYRRVVWLFIRFTLD